MLSITGHASNVDIVKKLMKQRLLKRPAAWSGLTQRDRIKDTSEASFNQSFLPWQAAKLQTEFIRPDAKRRAGGLLEGVRVWLLGSNQHPWWSVNTSRLYFNVTGGELGAKDPRCGWRWYALLFNASEPTFGTCAEAMSAGKTRA